MGTESAQVGAVLGHAFIGECLRETVMEHELSCNAVIIISIICIETKKISK